LITLIVVNIDLLEDDREDILHGESDMHIVEKISHIPSLTIEWLEWGVQE
jgi:hypothetical protein